MNKAQKIGATIIIASLIATAVFATAQTSQQHTPTNCLGTPIQGITTNQACILTSGNAWDDIMAGQQGIEYIKKATIFHGKKFGILCGTQEQLQQAIQARVICGYLNGGVQE
jgi:hypothetical protein